MVLETRLGDAGGREFDLWLLKIGAEIVPVDAEQADVARRAWRRYGKGHHAAALNYGDCFSYALAMTRGERCYSRARTLQRPTSVVRARRQPDSA